MVRQQIAVKQKLGLHARPAAAFVQIARQYAADVVIEKNGERVNAKSIMGVLMLAIARGDTIFLETSGPDEQDAASKLTSFLEDVGDESR